MGPDVYLRVDIAIPVLRKVSSAQALHGFCNGEVVHARKICGRGFTLAFRS